MPSKPRKPGPDDRPTDALALARACLQSGEPDMAEVWLQAWQERSENSEVRAARCLDSGRVLETAGHFDRALAHLAAGLALEPFDEDTAYFLNNNTGYILQAQGRFAQAEAFCRAAQRVDRLRHNAMKNLGLALAGQGRHVEGALHLMHACIAAPRDPRALRHLEALAAEQRDTLLLAWPDLDARIAELRRRIEPRGGDAGPDTAREPAALPPATIAAHEHAKAALAAFEAGRHAEALAQSDLGLACESPSVPLRRWLTIIRSRCLLVLEAPVADVLECAREAIELDPFESLSWQVLAIAWERTGQWAESARACIYALRLDLTDPDPLVALRQLVSERGAEIAVHIPDIARRVAVIGAAADKDREARERAGGHGPARR